MSKLNDLQIKNWIKNNIRFEGKGDGGGLYLSYRKSFAVPIWRFRYRFSGKQRVMNIGSYSTLSLADARKTAKELSAKVSLGHDVAGEKQELKAAATAKIEAKKNAFTAGQLADKYFNDKILGNWKHPNIVRSKIEKDIKPIIGHIPVDSVKPAHIDEILTTTVDRGAPTVANNVLRILKQMFDYAIKRHIVQFNPAAAFDTSDAGGKENSRDRVLSRSELVSLFDAMRKAKGFSQVNMITMRLLLITCVRKNELCRARKENFDLDAGTWCLLSEKTGAKVIIPLPPLAIISLKELFRLSCESEWLLPARKSQDRRLPHISESTLNVALKKVTPLMGVESFTIHDFRRTARTHIESLGFLPHIGERCINHKIRGMAGIYNRYDYFEERKSALELWATFLEGCENGKDWNVTPIRKTEVTK